MGFDSGFLEAYSIVFAVPVLLLHGSGKAPFPDGAAICEPGRTFPTHARSAWGTRGSVQHAKLARVGNTQRFRVVVNTV